MDNFVSTETGTGLASLETQVVRFRDHTRSSHDVLAETGGSSNNNNNNNNNDNNSDIEEAEEPVVGELRQGGMFCKKNSFEQIREAFKKKM